MKKDWREEYKKMKILSERQLYLLEHGPDSLASSWALAAMKNDYNKIMGNNK